MTGQTRPRFPLVQLSASHDVQGFTCGNRPGADEIDQYLKVNARAEQAAGLSQVWVAVDSLGSGDGSIAAYFSLAPLSVPISPVVLTHLGIGAVPYRAVGGYLLGRLGVSVQLQGEGLGALLVAAAIKTASQARMEVGGAFLAVDPKNDNLLAWYERLEFGFKRLDPSSSSKRRLMLKL